MRNREELEHLQQTTGALGRPFPNYAGLSQLGVSGFN